MLEARSPARRAGGTLHERSGSTIAVPGISLRSSADSGTRAGFTHPAFVPARLGFALQIPCGGSHGCANFVPALADPKHILFGLLNPIDKGHDDVIFFADEGGSWQVGAAQLQKGTKPLMRYFRVEDDHWAGLA